MVLVLIIIAASITLINFLDVKKISTERTAPWWTLPLLLIVTVCVPLWIILLSIFKLYRECIRMILKNKCGEKFVGLLNGPDSIHTTTETLQNVINTILIYQCPKTMSVPEFYETLKEKLLKASVLPKFNVIFKQEFGYPYMLKEESNFNTGFRKIELINTENHKLSKTELMLLINKYANSYLPKDNTIPWEILVGSQPIDWRDDNHNYYFAMCRYHHAIMDGVALMKLTVASHADQENIARISSERLSIKGDFGVIMQKCKFFSETFLAFMLIPSWYVSSLVFKKIPRHILERDRLRKRCHYALKIEDHPDYVEKVKRIKSKIPGVSFSAVLLSAISASLNEFLTKNSEFIKYINVILPSLPSSTELLDLTQMKLKDVKLQNDFSSIILDLPICISNKHAQSDILDRLNLINKKMNALKASSYYRIDRLFHNGTVAWLPQQLVAHLLGSVRCTAGLSFLPGIPKVACLDGAAEISDFLFWSTQVMNIGSSIVVNTYDGRLHIGVSIDKALIENYSDVQEIADNILKYLDVLDEKISKCCTNDA